MMMLPKNDRIAVTLKSDLKLFQNPIIVSPMCLHDNKGISVNVNKVTQMWSTTTLNKVLLSPLQKLDFSLSASRVIHAFGVLPIADDIKFVLTVDKIYKKRLFGWKTDKKEMQFNKQFIELAINRELEESITQIAKENCLELIKFSNLDNVTLGCDENGKIVENGSYPFTIQQHVFRPVNSRHLMSLHGWKYLKEDEQLSTFFRMAVISASLNELVKHKQEIVFTNAITSTP